MITEIKAAIFFGLFIYLSIYAQSNHDDVNYKKYKESYQKYLLDENKIFLNESVNYLSKYLIKNPNDAEGYYERSQLYIGLENNDNAKADWRKVLELNTALKSVLEDYLK